MSVHIHIQDRMSSYSNRNERATYLDIYDQRIIERGGNYTRRDTNMTDEDTENEVICNLGTNL